VPARRTNRAAPADQNADQNADRQAATAAALLAISRLWRDAIDRRLAPHGLGNAAWRALWHLQAAGASPVQAELAGRMGIERPTLARLLDRMERDGLVVRVPDPADRRANRVEATAAGRALMTPVDEAIRAVRARAMGGLDAAELATLLALLERIRLALSSTPSAAAGSARQTSPRPSRGRMRRAPPAE